MIELTHSIIDVQSVLDSIRDASCGAEVLFLGTTRQWTTQPDTEENVGKRLETAYLHYESYEAMAQAKLHELEAEARRKWPVKHVTIVHRLGKVLPEEASVAVAVSCPHRSEAFEAAKWLIDTIKHDVPIWKQEHYVQSGPVWIHPSSGNCRCENHTTSLVSTTAQQGAEANADATTPTLQTKQPRA